MLTLSWPLPLAGALLLLLIGNADGRRDGTVRWLTLVVSLAPCGDAGDMGAFDPASADFQFVERARGFRRSASTTPSASTASACCSSC